MMKVSKNLGTLMKAIIRKRRVLSQHRYNTNCIKFSGETKTQIKLAAQARSAFCSVSKLN